VSDGRTRRAEVARNKTHAKILAVAKRMLSNNHGPLTIKEVASTSGYSIATVYNHFPRGVNSIILELGHAVAVAAIESAQRIVESAGPLVAAEMFPVFFCEQVIETGGVAPWALSIDDKEVAAEWFSQPSISQIMNLLVQGGDPRDDVTHGIAQTSVYLTRGAIITYCIQVRSETDAEQRRRHGEDLLAAARRAVPDAFRIARSG